jgi:hypothetical protein
MIFKGLDGSLWLGLLVKPIDFFVILCYAYMILNNENEPLKRSC